jgi:hypothetical protein
MEGDAWVLSFVEAENKLLQGESFFLSAN